MTELRAACLRQDPRVAEAKRLLEDALADCRKELTGIWPPAADLKTDYAELIDRYSDLRGGRLYYPYLASGVGRGALVELADGSVKYDFINGIGVHHWGHSHPEMLAAGVDAALEDTVMQGNLQQGVASVTLAENLLAGANRKGAKLAHCFLTSSGAMANENALKIIFQKKHPAGRLLAFERCFAGRTLALARVTDKPAYRAGLPPTLKVDYVPFFDAENPEASTARTVAALRQHLAAFPGEHAGMCFELIQGEAGYYPGERRFFTALMDLLQASGVAVMIDEIQTFGRTTELFAFQYFGLDEYADVVTLGKMSQVCATLFTAEYRPQPGLISQTFTAGSAAIHAGLVVIRGLLAEGYLGAGGKVERCSQRFIGRLEEIAARHPELMRGPFGLGAMIAFTAYDGSRERARAFVRDLFDAGVIAFIAGSEPVRVRFLMPVPAVTLEDIDAVARIVEATLVRSKV